MYIESKENWIPRDCDRTQWNRNGEGKGGQSAQLASAKEYKRYQKIFGPCKLLKKVHQGFCSSSQANEYTDKERCKIAVGARAAKGI